MSPSERSHGPDRAARAVLAAALERRVFPAAVVEVGSARQVLWREAFGTLSFEPGATRTADDTVFDLASLTKPVATTSLVLQLLANGALRLSDLVADTFPDWRGGDREHATVQDLLEHAAGLPARLVDAPPATRREFEHDICVAPLEAAPRTRSIYTDLGFILLGFLVEMRGRTTLAALFDEVVERVTASTRVEGSDRPVLTFGSGRQSGRGPEVAPTRPLPEDIRRGRTLVGEVHDNYAAALGGVAGHAGLFGNAGALGAFARAALRAARGDHAIPIPLSPSLVSRATTRSAVPGSSRALGWDTMLPTSSCGTAMSAGAFGHVGFTGTSLWIDPIRDRYFVLLSNHACGSSTRDELRAVRRAFHDALADF